MYLSKDDAFDAFKCCKVEVKNQKEKILKILEVIEYFPQELDDLYED